MVMILLPVVPSLESMCTLLGHYLGVARTAQTYGTFKLTEIAKVSMSSPQNRSLNFPFLSYLATFLLGCGLWRMALLEEKSREFPAKATL